MRPGALDLVRNLDDPRQRARRLHDREAAVAAERVLAVQGNDEVQRLVENPRERVRRVQPQGRQHRQQFVMEELP